MEIEKLLEERIAQAESQIAELQKNVGKMRQALEVLRGLDMPIQHTARASKKAGDESAADAKRSTHELRNLARYWIERMPDEFTTKDIRNKMKQQGVVITPAIHSMVRFQVVNMLAKGDLIEIDPGCIGPGNGGIYIRREVAEAKTATDTTIPA